MNELKISPKGRIFKLKHLLLLIIAILAFSRTPDTNRLEMIAKYGSAPSKFLQLGNGTTIHYRDEGNINGPLIVLIHGNNSDLHDWSHWVDRLKGKYRIFRFDQIGHGLTGKSLDGQYSMKDFAESFELFRSKLGINDFTLVGHSMGGSVAIEYALKYPQNLNALVLMDATTGPPVPKEAKIIGFKIASTPILRQALIQYSPRLLVRKSLKQSVENDAFIKEEMVDRYWELLRFPSNRHAMVARFSIKAKDFTPDQIAQLKLPVLILWGENDQITPLSIGKWYKENIKQSHFILYPKTGHLPMIEQVEQSSKDLDEWIGNIKLLPPSNH